MVDLVGDEGDVGGIEGGARGRRNLRSGCTGREGHVAGGFDLVHSGRKERRIAQVAVVLGDRDIAGAAGGGTAQAQGATTDFVDLDVLPAGRADSQTGGGQHQPLGARVQADAGAGVQTDAVGWRSQGCQGGKVVAVDGRGRGDAQGTVGPQGDTVGAAAQGDRPGSRYAIHVEAVADAQAAAGDPRAAARDQNIVDGLLIDPEAGAGRLPDVDRRQVAAADVHAARPDEHIGIDADIDGPLKVETRTAERDRNDAVADARQVGQM